MAEIISGIYKIINTVTGDFYIGSSKDVKRRWKNHKYYIKCNKCPNNPLYLDMKKYGVEKFDFQILKEVEPDKLKEAEQQFIEEMQPTYNDRRANGLDVERRKEYNNQLCYYDDETLTLDALRKRFKRRGIPHPVLEAKKYLIK